MPVSPAHDEVLERRYYTDVFPIPTPVDIVNLFRPSEQSPPFDEAAIENAKVVCMQPGIMHDESTETARSAGIEVVMVRCIRIEQVRLVGVLR